MLSLLASSATGLETSAQISGTVRMRLTQKLQAAVIDFASPRVTCCSRHLE